MKFPPLRRSLVVVFGVLLLAVLAVPASGFMSAPYNGGDLTGTNMEGIDHWNTVVNSAQDCAALCTNTPGCEGATYVLPNTNQGRDGHCWRKSVVTGIVNDPACISFLSQSVSPTWGFSCWGPVPTPEFSASNLSGTAPLAVQFTDQSIGAKFWTWDFGDETWGPENTQQNPIHTYSTGSAQGITYTVKLTITSNCAKTVVKTRPGYITVYEKSIAPPSNLAPTANFTADKISGYVPLTVAFDATASADTDGTISQYAWDFGDGKTGSGMMPSHIYESAGAYRVSLTVTDDKGVSSSTFKNVEGQRSKTPPHADFTATPLTGISPLRVQFTDISSGSPTTWAWDFGDDGITYTVKNPTHTYTSAGTYTVSLRVTNADGMDTETKAGYIAIEGGGMGGLLVAGGLILIVIAGALFFLWSRSNLQLILKQKSVQADGTSSIPVRVQFVNGFGQLQKQRADRDVEIKTTSGMIQNVVVPEGKAYAETSLRASREVGPVTVTARFVAKEVKGRVDFLFMPGKLEVTPNPPEIPADGRSRATVTVRIQDASGNGVTFLEDKKVQLTTNLGTIISPVQIPARSQEGTTMITAGETSGTATINAFLDQIGGVGTIRFIPTGKRYCMHCGTAMRIDTTYCPECGKIPPSGVDTKSCAGCAAVIPQSARFCGKCGARQP
jgi:PKD repeat protein/RNA polymerase subunit RPABC4/transcription elongation factor Spt4